MENNNFQPLDRLIPRQLDQNKPYVFTIDDYSGKFMDPDNESAEYELGVLIEDVSVRHFRKSWLKTSQGERFLLDGDYNILRFSKLIEFMKISSEVWAPSVMLSGPNEIQIVDGRHRFLWFAIHEYETMSIVVPRHEATEIRELLVL